jgi:hypothetical protein
MTTLEILKAARDLISDPEHWTKRANARDSYGEIIGCSQPEAVRWCAYGALNKVSRGDSATIRKAYDYLMGVNNFQGTTLEGINDVWGHMRIISAFDAAIARLESVT